MTWYCAFDRSGDGRQERCNERNGLRSDRTVLTERKKIGVMQEPTADKMAKIPESMWTALLIIFLPLNCKQMS